VVLSQPGDCLTCHTPVANYVLGLNTRQLNGNQHLSHRRHRQPAAHLNRLGLFYPAFDEAGITNLEQCPALTNQNASLAQRARSYLDANCVQCHQPGGTGITFDARYDTPLTNQNLINAILSKGQPRLRQRIRCRAERRLAFRALRPDEHGQSRPSKCRRWPAT
jgi:hypothetical protein